MKEFLYLGSAPSEEQCVQVITGEDYLPAMVEECYKYKKYLENLFNIPDSIKQSTYFSVKKENHEFGPYYEVVIYFDDENEDSLNFAYMIEDSLPTNWKE